MCIRDRYRQVPLETDRRQARKLVFLLGMETAEELLRLREEPELLKWLEVIRGQGPVSYTHLDVYKRQVVDAMTLAADLLGREEAGMEEEISPRGEPMVVTPREIDLLIDRARCV